MTPKTSEPSVDALMLGGSILAGIAQTFADDHLEGVISTYKELRDNNARKEQSTRQYEYLHNNELKYLVDDAETRERFINTLLSEAQKLQETEQVGALPQDVGKKYKREAINAIMRIAYLNQNYEKYSKLRNVELQRLLRGK